MPRPFTPKIVTANDLVTGDVIYLAEDGSWVRDMCMAVLLDEEDGANARLAEAVAQPHITVGAYLADAKRGEKGPEPTHFREAFRARGPSNRLHGKQERAEEVHAHV
ncbi:hypothetical protein XMM379_001536 [Aliiroseovarius sp. xm-m-379]|uniref:DUF2849 domain-containing protein n=1 Tax=unclassified Aliiroseovarius TaxID=2623558 RepID=UPI001569F6F5|nr:MULTISPECIES: DUF2849 domain-containing protein [unclassified Aliiroseovarius]NRP12473.1 hypothetical protein [Aliiroseovarius sp. xm-d-517]NRP24847.1 hypothetical protein [Aliiroseovarius sp. xm-m-379]NRP30518.1 hypothetical protein [Aliiroseovarius sp. xm-m-314]NRP33646.1 hypothetical protein [Aliiroseovarius sp. xm-a-104]NRP40753.1 hypothetical protein [Aliiroseovarius sp. xm-m-339-2]